MYIYIKNGIANVTKVCLYSCYGEYAADFILYTPRTIFVNEIQSTLSHSKGHSFYIASKDSDNDAFVAENINVSDAYVTNINLHYSSGIMFWLHKNSQLDHIILQNCSSSNNQDGLISFDNNQTFEATFLNSIFINNHCKSLCFSKITGNTLFLISCSIFNNQFNSLFTTSISIQFISCYYDFIQTFLASASTDDKCILSSIQKSFYSYGKCQPFTLSFSCSKRQAKHKYLFANIFTSIFFLTHPK